MKMKILVYVCYADADADDDDDDHDIFNVWLAVWLSFDKKTDNSYFVAAIVVIPWVLFDWIAKHQTSSIEQKIKNKKCVHKIQSIY